MSVPDLLDRAESAVRTALRSGADAAEAYLVSGRSTEIRVRGGRVERTVRSDGMGCGLRVDHGRRQGFASSTDLSPAGIRALASSALSLSRFAPEDADALIPEVKGADGGVEPSDDLDDPELHGLSFERATEFARRAEAGALAADPRVRPGEGSRFTWSEGAAAIASSRGVLRAFSGTHCGIVCSPVAAREGEQQRQHWFETRRFLSDLPPAEEVGAEAGRRAARMLGARAVAPGRVNVVFGPVEGARFWGGLVQALIGDAARRKVSFLAEALGERVASTAVSLVDDPRLFRGPGSRPFDGEGLTTSRCPLIDAGRLDRFLFDTRTARRAGTASTASAVRGYGSPPSPGAQAPVLQPGETEPGQILAEAGRGLYVVQLIGFGTNLVTGDYSRGASGWWFEEGRFAHPVQEVTLSGNLRDMLRGIRLVGNDLVLRSATASPTFLVEGLVISGGGG